MNDDPFEKIHSLLRSKNFDAVLNEIINPGTGMLNPAYRFDANHAWYVVGCSFYEKGDFVDALAAFRRAYKSCPEDDTCLLAMANCYLELKRPRTAEKILREALEMNIKGDDKAAFLYNLANALYDQGRYVEATPIFKLLARRGDEIGRRSYINRKHSVNLQKKNKSRHFSKKQGLENE